MQPDHNQKKIRVLHLVLSLGVGGAEKLAYDMIQKLDKNEYTAVVCCIQCPGPLGDMLKEEGVSVYFRARVPGIDIELIRWLREILVKEKIDVIHAHQYTPFLFSCLAKLFLGKIKLIYTEHGRHYPEVRKIKRRLFNPVLSLLCDHIVSICESTRQAMIEYDNFPAKKISVILNGVKEISIRDDLDLPAKRASLGLDADSKIVGMAARLEDIKNIPMAIRAFKRVIEKRPHARLVIAGTGSKDGDLKSLASSLGLEKEVVFLGLRMDLPEIYRLFDVFLLSSFTEGLSVTLIEAMANAIPTVVTDVGGNPEVVVEGETGFLVPLNDDEAMAEKILAILDHPEEAGRMGANGVKRIGEKFTFDEMMDRYLRLYEN